MNIPKNIKAVIFDMDGLLIDSEPYWQKADSDFFALHSEKFIPEFHRYIMGMGQREVVEYYRKNFKIQGDIDQLIIQRKKLLYQHLLPNVVLMKDAERLIQNVHRNGYLLAIATSGHTKEKTLEILNKLNINSYFSVLTSGEDFKKSKPAPDIYKKTAELLHMKPIECLVFEDAPNGVIAGKAAGMTVYGVNKDEYFQNGLQKAGADEVFSSLSEITI